MKRNQHPKMKTMFTFHTERTAVLHVFVSGCLFCCCCCLLTETLSESVYSSLMRAVITKWTGYYPLYLLRTIMMSPDDRALEDLLYCGDLGDEAELGGGPAGMVKSAAADNVSITVVGKVFRSFTEVQVPLWKYSTTSKSPAFKNTSTSIYQQNAPEVLIVQSLFSFSVWCFWINITAAIMCMCHLTAVDI